jgi:hypothetical protein
MALQKVFGSHVMVNGLMSSFYLNPPFFFFFFIYSSIVSYTLLVPFSCSSPWWAAALALGFWLHLAGGCIVVY